MISTSIALDGEKEFKRQLGDVNSNLRTLKSELQLTTEEFKGQANSVDALEAKGRILSGQYEQQEEKVKALERALRDVGEVYADQPRKIDEYQQSLNRARTDLAKLGRELQDNERYLREARSSTDKTTKSLDEFGREAKDADDGLGRMGTSLGNLKRFLVGGAVVGSIKEAADAIFEITDATKGYRQIMGALEVSGERAGYTAEQTAETYERLYSVIGDYDAAKEAAVQLQALEVEQEKLNELTMQLIGSWVALGGAAPLESIAEHTNQTINAGKATGTFADILVNAGLSEDEFNASLEACNTTVERADLVMKVLAREGLAETAAAWMDVNDDIVSANKSQKEWDDQMAELGEFLQPAADALRSFGADAIGYVTDMLKGAVGWIKETIAWIENLNDKLVAKGQARMESYGYEAYYNEDGLLRYRQVESDLASANVTSRPAATAEDVAAAAAGSWAYSQQAGGRRSDHVAATITLQTDDGRRLGQYVTEFVNEENAANPPVESDVL